MQPVPLNRPALLCLLICVFVSAPIFGADAAAGAKVFATECAECHSMREGKDKKGPSLFGIVGAKAARREGFAYSDAMVSAGITWTPEVLSNYVAMPRKSVPGGKMKHDGLGDAGRREDLLAYLATAR